MGSDGDSWVVEHLTGNDGEVLFGKNTNEYNYNFRNV